MVAYADENRKRDQGDFPSGEDGLGELPEDSGINGDGSIRATEEGSERIDSHQFSQHGCKDSDIGKILERLEALERSHLAYLAAHKARLQARWQDDVEEEARFLRESEQLRQDIRKIASEE